MFSKSALEAEANEYKRSALRTVRNKSMDGKSRNEQGVKKMRFALQRFEQAGNVSMCDYCSAQINFWEAKLFWIDTCDKVTISEIQECGKKAIAKLDEALSLFVKINYQQMVRAVLESKEITYFINKYWRTKYGKLGAIAIFAASVGAFLMFYPVISGAPVNPTYIHNYLDWFPSRFYAP